MALVPLVLDPLKESLFVDQNSTASTFNYTIKAITFSIEDQMAKATLGRPFMMVVPFGHGDKPVIYCREVISVLHAKSPIFVERLRPQRFLKWRLAEMGGEIDSLQGWLAWRELSKT